MPKPVILATAWEDIEHIADRHMRSSGAASAEHVTDALLDANELLESMPYLGPVHSDSLLRRLGFRKLPVKPYVIVYRIIDDVPTVYDVFYQGQDYAARLAYESRPL